MTKSEILEWLKLKVDPELYRHSVATQEMAEKLAGMYNVDRQKAGTAGLLHDCAKRLSHQQLLLYAKTYCIPLDEIQLAQPGLLHAPVGAKLVQIELGIMDSEILHAIGIHNTGSRGMSGLDKALYLADSSEPNRDYPGVQYIRKFISSDYIDIALLKAIEIKIHHVIARKLLLHPLSVEARNDVLRGIKARSLSTEGSSDPHT